MNEELNAQSHYVNEHAVVDENVDIKEYERSEGEEF